MVTPKLQECDTSVQVLELKSSRAGQYSNGTDGVVLDMPSYAMTKLPGQYSNCTDGVVLPPTCSSSDFSSEPLCIWVCP